MLIINKMEWNNDLCIDLIEAYREQTTLWDPKHPSHYVKSEKLQAWTILANKFNTDILAVKNKMCNLLGSFRREKSKERRSMLASGNGKKAYKSKWFAYESMLFLQTRDDGRSDLLDMENMDAKYADLLNKDNEDGEDSEEANYENQYFEQGATDQLLTTVKRELPDEENEGTPQTSNDPFAIPESSKAKRPRIMKEDPLGVKQWLSPSDWLSDESTIYGQHIANKLRNYKPRTRALVEHAINNIIFEADMGKYDNVEFQSVNSNADIWNQTITSVDESGDTACASNHSP